MRQFVDYIYVVAYLTDGQYKEKWLSCVIFCRYKTEFEKVYLNKMRSKVSKPVC